jgi:hypothetical protein
VNRPAPPGYVVCPGCGSGWGRPHYTRCLVPQLPQYTRELGKSQVIGLVAFTVAEFPLNPVHRALVRAMLPRGEARIRPADPERGLKRRSWNPTSFAFCAALRLFEERGLIRRDETFIWALNRPRLHREAKRFLPSSYWLTRVVAESVAVVVESLPDLTPQGQAKRARQLGDLRRLMETPPGDTGGHQGRGYVRVIPRPGRP